MSSSTRNESTYLALGDSMSIDHYTGVKGGGAVSQFHRWLGDAWVLENHCMDMCRMRYVPTHCHGKLITLTIGGNDLIAEVQHYLEEGLDSFSEEHLSLLLSIRQTNPDSLFIVGNVYSPQTALTEQMAQALGDANDLIGSNVRTVGARLADIQKAFRGHEQDYLCHDIEPSLKGATVIADLFKEEVRKEVLF